MNSEYINDDTKLFGVKYVGPVEYIPSKTNPFGFKFVGERKMFYKNTHCPFKK
jgi:hypothetical protein